MRLSDFWYDLPEELIAQRPLEHRDQSRLMCVDKKTGEISHRQICDIVEYFSKGDCLILNDSRVIPARLFGYTEHGARVETLLLKRLNYTDWECIMRPAKKGLPGKKLVYSEELSATVKSTGENGIRIISFDFKGVFEEILERVGNVPLPPYITEKLNDKQRYQTVYAKVDGSAAAPTAGLHFTQRLMSELKSEGIEFAEVLLHVGLSTFRPVKEENVLDHKMHTEYYEISEQAAQTINKAVSEGRRVIAVGTTSGRVLESVADENGYVKADSGETSIFIYPGYKFKIIKGIITNFHLPESTLIMYVSAFCGRENTLRMYGEAVKERYRFFSFGDATFLF